MTPNDDLVRWGEPPASDDELRQADEELSAELREVDGWLGQVVETVLSHAGLTEPWPVAEGAPDLRLRVLRQSAAGFVLVGSTHPVPTSVRDMRRIVDDPDRVLLRTGDRAKIEVVCDREGYLTVFNVGPTGAINLLWPDEPTRAEVQSARTVLKVAQVMLTPPAGRERVYAVWSRVPLAAARLRELSAPGVTTRDMKRVQDAVDELRPEDWHAVLLAVDHEE